MTDASLDEQLTFAIANKRLIEVTYRHVRRVAEPHDYGILNGSEKLLIFQLRRVGGDRRGNRAGWRLLEVAKIEDCTVLDASFPGSRGDAHQQHYAWDIVYVRVS